MKHWVYIARKRPDADQKANLYWKDTKAQIAKEEAESKETYNENI